MTVRIRKALRVARAGQGVQRHLLDGFAVIVREPRDAAALVVADDDDGVPCVGKTHAQVRELGDIRMDEHRASGIQLFGDPAPALVRVIGSAGGGGDAEPPADILLHVGIAADDVDWRLQSRGARVQERQTAA